MYLCLAARDVRPSVVSNTCQISRYVEGRGRERWDVGEDVVMVGRMERELTFPWVVSLEATPLL